MRIAISQRVDVIDSYGERRDALDQAWTALFARAALTLVPVPNVLSDVSAWCRALNIDGALLSGGNDLTMLTGMDSVGGTPSTLAPERDATERALVIWARHTQRPVLGICRGMQHLVHLLGGELTTVARSEHVAQAHALQWSLDNARFNWTPHERVNSYHGYGIENALPTELRVIARSADGCVEAFEHGVEFLAGFMWHPERAPHRFEEVEFLRSFFSSTQRKST